MENENTTQMPVQPPVEQQPDSSQSGQPHQKLTTPMAIVIAGVLVLVGILLTGGAGPKAVKDKTLSEQVGISKSALASCMADTNLNDLYKKLTAEATTVMQNIPAEQRGTPYGVIVSKNGIKVELRGNLPYDDYNVPNVTEKQPGFKTLIAKVVAGTATSDYKGELPLPSATDHIMGSLDAPVIIVEYADLECPYCKAFGVTAKKIVSESNGGVAWVYRHWPVHIDTSRNQFALEKAAASECVAKIKGNDAFWQYIDLVFGLMDPVKTPIADKL